MQMTKELKTYTNYNTSLYIKQINAIEAIQDNYSGHIKDFTGWLSVNELNLEADSIELYFKELNKSDKYTAGTKRVKRQAVKSRVRKLYSDLDIKDTFMMNTALDKLDKDPATKAPKVNSVQITRDMYLTPDQIKELVEISRSERQKLFMTFLYKTGCRVAEMCSIKVSDCKNNNMMMKVRVTGKGNKERFVRISWDLFRAIEKEFHGNKYLFETSGGKPYRPEYVSNQIKKQGKRLNKNISAHTFRHSFFMEMIRLNPSKIDAISKYGGHSDPSITLKMYCHNQLEDHELMELVI